MSDFNPAKIRVIFMDIGGVLLTNGWGHESREKAAKAFDFDYQEMEILHNFIYNVFEIGSISLDEYLDTILFYQDRKFSKSDFIEFMFAQSIELPQMLKWVKEWKKKTDLPVFALSNESRELNDFRIQTFNLQQVFDGYFSSCYLGIRKPDPRIYKTALELAQVKPDECLYIDDRPMLVNAAKKMGICTVLHQEFEATKNILDNFTRK